eukprot:g3099.t1
MKGFAADEWELAQRKKRAKRFELKKSATVQGQATMLGPGVQGTREELEKSYFRLNEAPQASDVRPVRVLVKAHARVMRLWQSRERGYGYVNDQLKAIRQDLTVQSVRTDFAAAVYEDHCRIALESEDIPEVNQCLTQLHILYRSGVKGRVSEFTAYEILYHTYVQQKYKEGTARLCALLRELDTATLQSRAVCHALQVREAVSTSDYSKFFRLLSAAPHMSRKLVSLFSGKIRHEGARLIAAAYRPSVPVSFIEETLAVETSDEREHLRGELVLDAHGRVDTKATEVSFSTKPPFLYPLMQGDSISSG